MALISIETTEEMKLQKAFNDIKEGKPGVPYDTGKKLFDDRDALCILYKIEVEDPKYRKEHVDRNKKEMKTIAKYFGKTLKEMRKEINEEYEREEKAKADILGMWKSLWSKETRLPTAEENFEDMLIHEIIQENLK